MITKHIRLQIDFTITIADEPPEDELNPSDDAYHACQARLLAAVKAHPDVLRLYLHDLIVGQMHGHAWSDWDHLLLGGEKSFQELLAPAIATLSKDDQAFFREVHELDYFEEFIDLFLRSFTIQEEPTRLVEVEPPAPPAWVERDQACLQLWQRDENWRANALLAAENELTQRLLTKLAWRVSGESPGEAEEQP